jgi:hypothetical protein
MAPYPASSESELTRIFEEVPISVQLPPSIEAKEMGMRNFDGLRFIFVHTVRTAGINTTTTGVLLMKADMKQTAMRAQARNLNELPWE